LPLGARMSSSANIDPHLELFDGIELWDYAGNAGMLYVNLGDYSEPSKHLVVELKQMQKEMGIPSGFDCIKDEDIPQIIQWAKKEANPLYPVPVIWGDEELRQLIESIRL
ncbi:MAG: hypothetical protein ACSW8K_11735, partial [bacterium]